MASSEALIQSPVPTCDEHDEETLSVLCFTCIQRICELCLKDEHFQHDWSSMARVIRVARRNAKEREKVLLGFLQDERAATQEMEIEAEISKIDAMEDRLHSLISSYANTLRSRLREGRTDRCLGSDVTELEKMISFFSDHIKDAHDNVVFEMEECFLGICKIHEEKTKNPKPSPTFREGNVSEDIIADMFGKVTQNENNENEKYGKARDDPGGRVVDQKTQEKGGVARPRDDETAGKSKGHFDKKTNEGTFRETNGKVTEITSFTHGKERIVNIAPISHSQAWMNEYKSETSYQVDMKGKVTGQREIGSYMTDVVVLDNNDFIYTMFGERCIRRSLASGKVENVCSTSIFHPGGISLAHDGGLLVCLRDCYPRDINPNSKGEVHHMDLSGKIIKEYKELDDSKTKFVNPNKVAHNINRDICVTDNVKPDFTSRLIVFTAKGKTKFVYEGQSSLRERFVADIVCCDTQSRILVTDNFNFAVHQLSPDGQFLQLLLTEQNLPTGPKSLALSAGNLWVGCKEGVVKVFKYE